MNSYHTFKPSESPTGESTSTGAAAGAAHVATSPGVEDSGTWFAQGRGGGSHRGEPGWIMLDPGLGVGHQAPSPPVISPTCGSWVTKFTWWDLVSIDMYWQPLATTRRYKAFDLMASWCGLKMMPECGKFGHTEASRRRGGRCQSHAGEASAKVWHQVDWFCTEETRYLSPSICVTGQLEGQRSRWKIYWLRAGIKQRPGISTGMDFFHTFLSGWLGSTLPDMTKKYQEHPRF